MNECVHKIFGKYISSGKPFRIKLLGDSITQGCGGTDFLQSGEKFIDGFARSPDGFSWANLFRDYMQEKYNCTVINNGCAGTKIEFILENYNVLTASDDDITICMIGTNNRNQYITDPPKKSKQEYLDTFYMNLLELYSRLKAENKDFVFMCCVPTTPDREKDTEKLWRIFHMSDLNELYKKAHKEKGFPFVSLYELFGEYIASANIDMDSVMYDGLHPNDEGYKIMYNIIIEEFGV